MEAKEQQRLVEKAATRTKADDADAETALQKNRLKGIIDDILKDVKNEEQLETFAAIWGYESNDLYELSTSVPSVLATNRPY